MLRECTPTLLEYLSSELYDDGTARRTATLTVFVEQGSVKLCLSDRDTGRTAWMTGESLEDALSVLEQRLKEGTADWRSAGPKGATQRRK